MSLSFAAVDETVAKDFQEGIIRASVRGLTREELNAALALSGAAGNENDDDNDNDHKNAINKVNGAKKADIEKNELDLDVVAKIDRALDRAAEHAMNSSWSGVGGGKALNHDNDDDDNDDDLLNNINLNNCNGNEDDLLLASASPSSLSSFPLCHETALLFQVAAPGVLIQFSLFFIFPQAASAVGRLLTTTDLAAFSLGSLIGNLTCLSILEGALTAADTLQPRAYGAGKYEEVARIAVRAFCVGAFLLSIPVLPLCLCSTRLLLALGQDAEAAVRAQTWIRYYFIGAVPNLLYRVYMRFLLSQQQPWPLVIAAAVPSLFLQPFLLHWLVPIMGLPGSALAVSLTQWSMTILLVILVYVQQRLYGNMYHPQTWPGLSWNLIHGALQTKPLLHFLHLSVGGILSYNEWWFFEIMCFVAGSFGVVPLCIHTIAYNLVPLLFMIPLGMMIGLVVRMGHVIAIDYQRAKLLAAWCMFLTAMIGLTCVTLLYVWRVQIIHIFTKDEEVVQGALQLWTRFVYYIFMLYFFGINQAILRALAMQWRIAVIVSTFLFGFTLPAVFYFAVYRHGGLTALWTVLPCFYTLLQIVLAAGYLVEDWQGHSILIREQLRKSIVVHAQKEVAAVAAAMSSSTPSPAGRRHRQSRPQQSPTETTPLKRVSVQG